jgi:hypothetical protein
MSTSSQATSQAAQVATQYAVSKANTAGQKQFYISIGGLIGAAVSGPIGIALWIIGGWVAMFKQSGLAGKKNTSGEQVLIERMCIQIPMMQLLLAQNKCLVDDPGGHPDEMYANAVKYIKEFYNNPANTWKPFGPGVSRWYWNQGLLDFTRKFFTVLFGVRITTGEDLDALDYGAEAYYKRPDKADVKRSAVDRAVFLKQNYYPISSYNNTLWDISKADATAYTEPIPAPTEVNQLYNGDFGGLNIVQGVPETYELTNTEDTTDPGIIQKDDPQSPTSKNKKLIYTILIILGVIAAIIFAVIMSKKSKK